MKWLKKIKVFFQCKVLGSHNWTSAAEQGKAPTQEQLDAGVDGFKVYATMYCEDCGKVCDASLQWWTR